ncbi:hypothetical protein B7463_g4530, partial [Scytalidium lignicola]
MRWARLFTSAAVVVTAGTAIEASTLKPPVLPLTVRNPYLSTWLGNARGLPWEHWPMFWTGQEVGFSVLASVPQAQSVFPLLGRPQDSLPKSYNVSYPTYLGATYDASTTNLTYQIPVFNGSEGPLQIVLSFLSPITPTSTFRQSIPASYLAVHVNGDVDIDIYVDINGLWVSGNRDNDIEWLFSNNEGPQDTEGTYLKTWKIKRRTEQFLTEFNDRAEWGTLHFTGPADVQHEAGTSASLRQRFARTGTLSNSIDSNFRKIMDEEPVFAFAKSFKLGDASSSRKAKSSDTVLFTIAHIQETVIQFASARGLTYMRPLWASYYLDTDKLLHYHYYDFKEAFKLASNYSQQLEYDALQSGSEDYKDIVALSARQVMGATCFSGTPEEPILFLKEISSDGNLQTVDVIFPAFPFFLYTNPRWLANLLDPLIEYQLSGQYPNDYCMHDLGSSYPNATGHLDGRDEYMPVEESGNFLIMALALINSLKNNDPPASIWSNTGNSALYGPASGVFPLHIDADGIDDSFGGVIGAQQARSWAKRAYPLLKQWTGYLVREALIPRNQLSTDDFAGWLANQTNLALKGIIGIRAMSEISDLVGETKDAKFYRDLSESYIEKWQQLGYGLSRDKSHMKLAYTWYGSWGTMYNLFASALLCFEIPPLDKPGDSIVADGQQPLMPVKPRTKFIDEKIYKIQNDWYHSVRQKYGLPLDSRHLYTKLDWEFFAVAVASQEVREEITESIALWVNETTTDRPLTDLYDTEQPGWPGINFKARPVVGGSFAYMSLERACNGKAAHALAFLNEVKEKDGNSREKFPLGDGEL